VECVAALHEAGRRLPFAIEVVAFGDEEGSRFPAAMLTSRAMAGTLDEAALDMADARGVTLAEAMATFGLDIARWREAKLARAPLAYLEAHIEQGPVLERRVWRWAPSPALPRNCAIRSPCWARLAMRALAPWGCGRMR
jgi:allantoate deiminase